MIRKYDVLDVFRLIAALFVVGIHSWPLPDLNSNIILFQGIGRFAVPFFLLTSGFLLHKKLKNLTNKEEVVYIWRYVKRLFQFYVAWWLVYLWLTPLKWGGTYRFEGQHGMQLLKSLFNQYILYFFTGSTFIGSWYISATIIGVIIVFVLFRRLSVLLQLLIGILWLGALLIVLLQGKKVAIITVFLSQTPQILPAETFLVAVPFIIFGRAIAKYEEKLSQIPITLLVSIVIVLIAVNKTVLNIKIPSARYIRNLASFVYMGQFGLLILASIVRKHVGIMFSNWTMYAIILLLLFLMFEILQSFENKRNFKLVKYLW
ncbi:acyltransferase family protein [Leuconostoc gelidum]|uniref:Acyltransferase family protein n=1 Tax=Leuconostoc gelidum subsp. gelidum TaxID=1607839 RepID=A0ABS7V237_LEUGE|nr:acyltransferase family protein [Leuconostoc gelidum]MBZ5999437.1 acyltransferase family protein [Leuconostoc gelidum subsp. gelidum]